MSRLPTSSNNRPDTGMSGRKRHRIASSTTTPEEVEETAQQKKVRLAKEYLASVNVSIDGESDDEEPTLVEGSDDDDDDDDDLYADEDPYGDDKIGQALKRQALKAAGREERTSIVSQMDLSGLRKKGDSRLLTSAPTQVFKGHRSVITSLALSEDNAFAISGDSKGSIIQNDLETGKKTVISLGIQKNQNGHRNAVNDLTLSSDNVYLASAGEDKTVRIWDLRSGTQVHQFTRHTARVSSITFKKDSLALFSAGDDRVVNVYDLEEGKMNFVETLYGHSLPVTGLHAHYMNRLFSSSMDGSVRIWKLDTESQAVLKPPKPRMSIDTISAIDHDCMVTGSESGHLDLWTSNKGKPVHSISSAHSGQWVSAVDALYARDIVASGSNDGHLRLWQANIDYNRLVPLFSIPVKGWINRIKIGNDARFVLAAIGVNHRLGRWQVDKDVLPGLHLYSLDSLFADGNSSSDEESA